jgi:hypothetical protein
MRHEILELGNIGALDIEEKLSSDGELRVRVTKRNARTLQRAWDKYGAYKRAYHEKNKRKGNLLSFLWMLESIKTSIFHENLEKVAGIYYDHWTRLKPVEFADEGDGTYIVIFSLDKLE